MGVCQRSKITKSGLWQFGQYVVNILLSLPLLPLSIIPNRNKAAE